MITKLGNIAVGSHFLLVRYGNRYKVISSSIVQNRIQILCKCGDSDRIVQLHSTCNVWINPKPKIELKANRVHTTS